jgi:hypothetical protein
VAAKPGTTWNAVFDALKIQIAGVADALHAFGDAPKHHRTASSGLGELPESYGRARVTLMVVNPYLLHAYWDLGLTKLPPDTQSAVLRFQENSLSRHCPGAVADPPRHTFDVEVDLRTRNWYIHLGSPAKSYQANLGVKTSAGQFVPLAHSNSLNTPRAWPVADLSPQVSERLSNRAPLARTGSEALPLQQQAPEQQAPEQKAPTRPLRQKVPRQEAFTRSLPVTLAAPVSLQRVDAAETLQKKLAEIYSLRQWAPRTAAALASAGNGQPASSAEAGASPDSVVSPASSDLTALAEHRFSPGFSSAPQASAAATRRPG